MNVLISGASIAGPTLAYWLAKQGFDVTVVEHAPRPRRGGYPIDVRGEAVKVAAQMGILSQLQDAAVHTHGLRFVNAEDHVRAVVHTGPTSDIELPRGDLAAVLYEATREKVEYVFGDSIVALEQDSGGVSVSFRGGGSRRFDLVFGADGLHSVVRELVFGPGFIRDLGFAVAVGGLADDLGADGWVTMYNEPGRMAGIGRWAGADPVAIFMHKVAGTFRRDKEELASAYEGDSWFVPRMLAGVGEEFYYDTVSQVRMPAWSRGRVALLGDAAHCSALLSGAGTSLAMVDARVLAETLGEGEFGVAFGRYERRMRPVVARAQRGIRLSTALLVPGSRAGIWRRDVGARVVERVARVRGRGGVSVSG